MNLRIQRKIASTVLLLCVLTACSFREPARIPVKRTYVLQGDLQTMAADASIRRPCAKLRINVPTSAPGFKTAKMAYIQTPRHIQYFSYHEWIDTPAKMIASMIESRLDSLEMFAAVLSGSPDVRADYRLDSEVKSLLQEFDDDTSRIDLTIKVSLVDLSRRSLLNSKTFSYEEATDRANPESGVVAANRAAERFLIELTEFLAESTELTECAGEIEPAADR